jgi:hypothetical protein
MRKTRSENSFHYLLIKLIFVPVFHKVDIKICENRIIFLLVLVREGHELKVFENKASMKIIVAKVSKLMGRFV